MEVRKHGSEAGNLSKEGSGIRLVRTRQIKGGMTKFETVDMVQYFHEGDWKEIDKVMEVRTHSSKAVHAYHIKNSDKKIIVRPHKHARIMKGWALIIAQKLD